MQCAFARVRSEDDSNQVQEQNPGGADAGNRNFVRAIRVDKY